MLYSGPAGRVICSERRTVSYSVVSDEGSIPIGKKRYQIHPAFQAYLELKPVDADGQQPMLFFRQ